MLTIPHYETSLIGNDLPESTISNILLRKAKDPHPPQEKIVLGFAEQRVVARYLVYLS